jgi:hypothetical protein
VAELKYKCPHCGKLLCDENMPDGMVPTHDFPKLCRQVCPGSGQHPRGVVDLRPLWKDEKGGDCG